MQNGLKRQDVYLEGGYKVILTFFLFSYVVDYSDMFSSFSDKTKKYTYRILLYYQVFCKILITGLK